MKPEEVLNKAYRAFQGDEDETLLRLAKLKERADYRAFFEENKDKVRVARASEAEQRKKGLGHTPDKETSDTLTSFYDAMLRRFGILPSSYVHRPTEEWMGLFDPLTDAKATPAMVLGEIFPWLFYWPGVHEVVTLTPPMTVLIGRGECPRVTDSAECAPHERLLKIDLRKKPSQLKKEFEAFLQAVEACRGMNPQDYETWKQDRTRKREEEWTHLEVWRMRKQAPKPSFPEIAKKFRITTVAAKKSFYRAFELIYGEPFNLEAWGKERAENPSKTCANCPQREGCTEPCPEIFEEKASMRELLTENIAEIGDSHSYSEWLTREEENE